MSAAANNNNNDNEFDAYRKRNETEREWQLRKLFIERFRDQFDHERLLCLAQCYVNIKTLGCRYSDRIMSQIRSLTVDFDPIIEERIEPIIKEMRAKNSPQQLNSSSPKQKQQQQQQQQARNSPKPQQQTQQTQSKQKLISKTQFVLGSPLQTNQPQMNANSTNASSTTVSNPIQILARQQSQQQQQQQIQQSPKQSQPQPQQTPKQQQQQQQPITPNSKKSGQMAMSQSQSLLGKSPAASSGVPLMTGASEAAPNPTLLPLPFGLQSSSSPSIASSNKPVVRNVLLAQLSTQATSSSPSNPLAIFTAAAITTVQPPPLVDDQNFRRLARVNKLRDVLRDEQSQLQIDEKFDFSSYLEQKCANLGIQLDYNQFEYNKDDANNSSLGDNPESAYTIYYGELILETFCVSTYESKKHKKCKSAVFKFAYEMLTSKSELGIKQVSSASKRNPLLLSSKQAQKQVANYEYELYRLDGAGDLNHRRVESVSKNLCTTTTTMNTSQDFGNMISLNEMLRSMILPKGSASAPPPANTSMDVSAIEDRKQQDDDDDDDENRSQGSNKKSKIKQKLANFMLFIPSSSVDEEITTENLDKFIHERNSINVLQNSCAKCKCAFELDTKVKQSKSKDANSANGNGKNATGNDQESDDQDSPNNDTQKIKCKCWINGVKIATASAKNKNDAKRFASLKALKYLSKMFPVIKETSYQSIINNSTAANDAATTTTAAMEASKNALMSSLGLMPQPQPQPQTSNAFEPKYFKISKEELFSGLIPPTMFEASSCSAAAAASSIISKLQTDPSTASSSFGTN